VPFGIVRAFEERIAAYAGAPYGVAVESCTAAIFLSLMWRRHEGGGNRLGEITIPARTYPSVPCAIIHAGGRVKFSDEPWQGEYELKPYCIIDGALRFKAGMYLGGLHCLSFHMGKHLPIGRGGMILTGNEQAAKWLRRARYDGRNECPLNEDSFNMLGWNAYMTPEQAARGLYLFHLIKDKNLPDLPADKQNYPDLSRCAVYNAEI
jgi:dTDP-4-amino-4,6-dideoxygalactose transaminase